MPERERVRTLIVDDEPLARHYVRQLLETDAEVQVIGECSNGSEAAALLRREPADLLFLDIEMPERDGFALLEALGSSRPAVVFVTAHDRYAVRAFEVQALDYLLKPFDEERFLDTLRRAKDRLRRERTEGVLAEMRRLLEDIRSRNRPADRLFVRTGERSFFLLHDAIDWIEAHANYVRIHSRSASYLVRESIGSLEARLDRRCFRRIHRSVIVNLDKVVELQPWFHGEHRLLLRDGTELRVSRTYRKNLGELGQG